MSHAILDVLGLSKRNPGTYLGNGEFADHAPQRPAQSLLLLGAVRPS